MSQVGNCPRPGGVEWPSKNWHSPPRAHSDNWSGDSRRNNNNNHQNEPSFTPPYPPFSRMMQKIPTPPPPPPMMRPPQTPPSPPPSNRDSLRERNSTGSCSPIIDWARDPSQQEPQRPRSHVVTTTHPRSPQTPPSRTLPHPHQEFFGRDRRSASRESFNRRSRSPIRGRNRSRSSNHSSSSSEEGRYRSRPSCRLIENERHRRSPRSRRRSPSRSPRPRPRSRRSPPPRRRSRNRSPRSPSFSFEGSVRNGRGRLFAPESKILGVFGISTFTQERDLRQVFARYGRVRDVQLVMDRFSQRSRGFGFVYMERLRDAIMAKESCNGMQLNGRVIRVDYSITPRAHSPTPGRYMGNYGPLRRRFGSSPIRSSRHRSPSFSPAPYRRR